MNILAIIPARYASTRFPGKPLVDIQGKSMIQRVYESAANVLENVVVATDDHRIYTAVGAFGGKVIMTSNQHKSGTDRCVEALAKYIHEFNFSPEVVLNIQGDEPFLNIEHIQKLCNCFTDPSCQIATLVKKIASSDELINPNYPKVVLNNRMEAIYFSRSAIPYLRNKNMQDWYKKHAYYKHIGIYGYRTEVLKEISKLPQSPLEIAESLEQLRWIENGYSIKVDITDIETPSVDTPEDLERILAGLNSGR